MTPTRLSTRDLFASAVDVVRATPLVPPDRPPAYVLDSPPVPGPQPAGEQVEGVPGDLWETASRLRSGELRVRDLIDEAYARMDAHADRLGAFVYTSRDEQRISQLDAEARRGDFRGPLHGLPISVKDIIDVEGMPTSGSSVARPARVAASEGVAVARLRAAGAVLTGKAATHEFALGVTTPQAAHPWDERRVPGGSSGGSAISLVTGMALGSLGTDTRASIRVPAALCGCVGFKPSLGVVPADRWLTLSWTMDHLAPMARSVRDIAILMDVLTGEPGRWTGVLPGSIAGLRVGVAPAFLDNAEAGVYAAFDHALRTLAIQGAKLVELDRPTAADLALANAAGLLISRVEAAQFHGEAGTDLDRCTPEVRDQLREAGGVRGTAMVRAFRLRGQLRDLMAGLFEHVDLLAMPTSKVVAPLREHAEDYLLVLSENCIPWSLVDFPAISLHAGLSERLPCGIQLVGPPGHDLGLLAAAHGVASALPVPPLWRPE